MLLCAPCHHLIDTNCQKYPRGELEAHKREHESRIKRVTALGPAMQTTVLQLKARIGTSVVEVSQAESARALLPRYPAGDPKIIDLTGLGDEASAAFYEFAAGRIRDEVMKLYATGGEPETSKHLSVLALGRERLFQRRQPLRRHARRRRRGAVERRGRCEETHHLPMLIGLDELEQARHLGEVLDPLRAVLGEHENPLWGAPCIHGELLKLGFEVA
jgi:hypothetical protein